MGTDDYTTQFSLKCKKNAGPVAVTIESNRLSSGSITSKVGTKFSYAGLKFDKFQFKPDGSYALETSLSPFNGTLMTFKGGKGSDLGLQYTKGNFLATGTLDVKDMQKISATASLGVASGISLVEMLRINSKQVFQDLILVQLTLLVQSVQRLVRTYRKLTQASCIKSMII